MKLVIAVVHNREKPLVTAALVAAGFVFTKLGSTGGFLREGNTTLLIGAEDADVPRIVAIFKEQCHKGERIVSIATDPDLRIPMGTYSDKPITEECGGGIAFVVDVQSVERF